MWRLVTSTSAHAAERRAGCARARRRAFLPREHVRERGRSGGRRGFTLIEVLVALTIVAFAFVGLLGLQNRNLAVVANDLDLTRATLLARQFITEMELIEQFPDTGTSRGEFANSPGFYWERDVQDTELPTVRRVQLRVIWDERLPNACELIYYIRDRREADDV
jgi:general secretion pathway protein I